MDLAHDGRGVARVDGKAMFVTGALPGERVRLCTTGRHRSHDEAVVEEVLQASPQRVVPACPHYGVCGGCALQHLAAPAQIEFKQQQLQQALERIGGVHVREWLAPLAGPEWQYRRRARLGAKFVAKKGRVLVGFRERAAPFIADLQECRVLDASVGMRLPQLAALIGELSIADRVPQIEVAVGDNAAALVLRVLAPPSASDLERLRAFERSEGLRVLLQPGGPDSIEPLTPGWEALSYELPASGIRFEFEPTDFVQVNAPLNRRMVEHSLALLAPSATDAVLDLFCGIGNFTLPLARRVATVVGVEGDAGLIERARGNAQRNGITNAEYCVADLFQDQAAQAWARRRYDRVVLDPPRAGAREVLPLVAASGARRVVYISCHAASLARDAGLLVTEHGMTLAAAGVMDMFPHTAHVEAVAVFER